MRLIRVDSHRSTAAQPNPGKKKINNLLFLKNCLIYLNLVKSTLIQAKFSLMAEATDTHHVKRGKQMEHKFALQAPLPGALQRLAQVCTALQGLNYYERILSSLRDSEFSFWMVPALKGWAIFKCPDGT
jgi:hypothetical protein